jgi:hypothetical protein
MSPRTDGRVMSLAWAKAATGYEWCGAERSDRQFDAGIASDGIAHLVFSSCTNLEPTEAGQVIRLPCRSESDSFPPALPAEGERCQACSSPISVVRLSREVKVSG